MLFIEHSIKNPLYFDVVPEKSRCILTSRVFKSNSLILRMADFASVYMMWSQIAGHPIKIDLSRNVKIHNVHFLHVQRLSEIQAI